MTTQHNKQKTQQNQTKATAVEGHNLYGSHVITWGRNDPRATVHYEYWDRVQPEKRPGFKLRTEERDKKNSEFVRQLRDKWRAEHPGEVDTHNWYAEAIFHHGGKGSQYNFDTTEKHAVIKTGIGRITFKKDDRSKITIDDASETIARNLWIGSNKAINPWREDDGRNIVDLDTVNGHIVKNNTAFQNWNIIPAQATVDRKNMANALALYLYMASQKQKFEIGDRDGEIHEIPVTHPSQKLQFRYLVLTGGPRIPLGMIGCRIIYIRARLQKAIKKLTKCNIPIHVIFQGLEVTLKREVGGTVSAHPHINVLYRFERQLTKEEWNNFLNIMQEVFTDDDGNKLMWKECGILKNVEEVVKYVTKMEINDEVEQELNASIGEQLSLEYENDDKIKECHEALKTGVDDYEFTPAAKHIGLVDLTPAETLEYFYQLGPRDRAGNTKRRKIMIPMGDFKTVNSTFKEWGIKFSKVMFENGEFAIRPVAKERRDKPNKTPGGAPRRENIVLSETLPHPGDDGRATTKFKVLNFTNHPQTPEGKRNLQYIKKLLAERAEWCDENGHPVDLETVFKNMGAYRAPKKRDQNKTYSMGRTINVHTYHDTKTKNENLVSSPFRYFSLIKKTNSYFSKQNHELSEIVFIQGLTASPPPRIYEPHTVVFHH